MNQKTFSNELKDISCLKWFGREFQISMPWYLKLLCYLVVLKQGKWKFSLLAESPVVRKRSKIFAWLCWKSFVWYIMFNVFVDSTCLNFNIIPTDWESFCSIDLICRWKFKCESISTPKHLKHFLMAILLSLYLMSDSRVEMICLGGMIKRDDLLWLIVSLFVDDHEWMYFNATFAFCSCNTGFVAWKKMSKCHRQTI